MPKTAVAEKRVLVIGDTLEKVAVVGDDDERAGPRVEQVFHGGEHVGVEIVGRLIQDQHVRFTEEQS